MPKLLSYGSQSLTGFYMIATLTFNELIHITIMILRLILYLVYLYPCLGLGLFMSYLCDLFSIFSLIFIVINHITSFKQTHLFFVHFFKNIFYHFWMITWIKKVKNFQIVKVQSQGVA